MRRLTRAGVCALLLLLYNGAGCAEVRDLSGEFDYFANSWGVVGLKDYPDACRLTPDGCLRLADGVQARWLLGEEQTPLPGGVHRELPGGLPLPESRVLCDGVLEYRLRAFAVPLAGHPWDYLERGSDDGNFAVVAWAHATNVSAEPQRPHVALRLEREGQPLPVTAADGGDAVWQERVRASVFGPAGLARTERAAGVLVGLTGEAALAPGASADAFFRLPYQGLPLARPVEGPPNASLYDAARGYWARLLRTESPRVAIPEPKVRDTYFASLAYTFIGRDDGRVHAGEDFYDGFFLRDGAYQVWALEAAGFLDEARPSALDFLNYQQPNGQFESQGGELDGNGQALWQLVRHYEMTHDEAYLRQVYPPIRRSMVWLTQALQRAPGDPDAAFAGVLPRSWADGEALPKSEYHVVGYDVWNLRGAQCAVLAAEALGEEADAAAWRALAERYKADLLRLIGETGARDLPPTLELAGTDWGNLECIYPTPLLRPFDPRVSATFADARRTFVEGTIRWCPDTQRVIHPYMSTFITNSQVIRGEYDRAVQGLYAFLLHSTSDHGLPEGVHYGTRTAWGDTVPHLWAAAQYVLLVRDMLVRERDDELHLASAVPTHWLEPGREVAFENAPTFFGPAGFRMQAEADRLRVWVSSPPGTGLRQVVVHLPPSIAIAGAVPRTGTLRSVDEHQFVLAPGRALVELRVRRGVYKRCDYRTTVAHYRARHREKSVHFASVLRWPLTPPADPDRCRCLDLRGVANVDPFSAPFGTLRPGKYLFTGMPTGRVQAAGVPFEVIDPAANDGEAFVVLQGSGTSASFPLSVGVPVDVAGTRAFFLGQVTGWLPDDPGDPKAGAIGEYVLVYADGHRQTVPLVSGGTVDDWAMAPRASLTQVGLQGDPWHLSVLAVKLRPVRLERIIVKDHGTPAAPLLAAITIEQ